jgi:hypothetical protein
MYYESSSSKQSEIVRGLGARECVLVVAQEIDLRARIACALRSSGYAVELAIDESRALKLASSQEINAVIVVPGSSQDVGEASLPLIDTTLRTPTLDFLKCEAERL